MFQRLRAARKTLPSPTDYGHIWFNPKTQTVYFTLGDRDHEDTYEDWKEGLKVKGVKNVIGGAETPPDKHRDYKPQGPWIRVKQADFQSIFGPLAQAGGWKSSPIIKEPTPLSAMLASGALAAGAGYGIGTLAEQVLPKKYFDKGKLRRTLGIAGGIAGAIPGFWAGTANLRHGTGFLDPIGSASQEYQQGETFPGSKYVQASLDLSSLNQALDILMNSDEIDIQHMNKLADAYDRQRDYRDPSGLSFYGAGGSDVMPIEKDDFNNVVWRDPHISTPNKGIISGVLEGASQVGGDTNVVYPTDVARLAVGMGSGYLSGLVVGKTLGALAGLNQEAQTSLQRAGIFGGLVSNLVPMLFGR